MTKTVIKLLALTFILAILPACSGTRPLITAQQPLDVPFRTELAREVSVINIAFDTTADDLAKYLNRSVAKDLYKGPIRNSSVTANVTRSGAIAVGMANSYITVTVPVTLSLSYALFRTPDLALKAKFRMNALITPDWKVKAEVHYMGLDDQLADEVKIGPLAIKPRSTVEGLMAPVQKTLSDLATSKLNEFYPLKTRVEPAWRAAQKPVLLNREYGAWLQLSPQEVMMSPIYVWDNHARLRLGITAYADLIVGPEPAAPQPAPLPPLKQVGNMDKNFRVSVKTDLFYKELVSALAPKLLGKDFGSDGKQVILKNFDLYGNGERLVIKVETQGSLEGIFYLTCRPAFNPQTSLFSVEDVDFDMNTESVLLNSADWFLHGAIRDKLHEKLNLDLTRKLADSRDLAQKALSKVELAKNVYLQGKVKEFRFNNVLVQKEKLTIQLYAEGETTMTLQ